MREKVVVQNKEKETGERREGRNCRGWITIVTTGRSVSIGFMKTCEGIRSVVVAESD